MKIIIKELLISLVIICGFISIFVIRTILYNNKISEYFSAQTINQVTDKNIPGITSCRISTDVGAFIEVVYPFDKYTLHSGPAVQVFDLDGNLVDKSRDTGDDPVFQEKWEKINREEEIDLKDF